MTNIPAYSPQRLRSLFEPRSIALIVMLDELQGKALLRGARGSNAADLDRLVEVVYRTSRLAQALGDRLESLEINPFRVDGAQIEALDAVITWQNS